MSETPPNVIYIVNCTLVIICFWAVNSQVNFDLEKKIKTQFKEIRQEKNNSATALSNQ